MRAIVRRAIGLVVLVTGIAWVEVASADVVTPTADVTTRVIIRADLAADVLVVGHHGSRTSSRRAFLDAVAASTFMVSSPPTKYQSVTLPDHDVITELEERGSVFRTDVSDATCRTNPAKTGADNDGRAGGCHHVRVILNGLPAVQASVVQVVD